MLFSSSRLFIKSKIRLFYVFLLSDGLYAMCTYVTRVWVFALRTALHASLYKSLFMIVSHSVFNLSPASLSAVSALMRSSTAAGHVSAPVAFEKY